VAGTGKEETPVATWSDLLAYVRSNYTVAEEEDGWVKMIFDVGDLRSQVVFLQRHALLEGSEDWLVIESPFGELGDIDLPRVLAEVGKTVVGGAALVAGHILTVRHAVPLENLNINEFERPLALVTTTADRLEKHFVGGDEY
jgi:hypothetical protein